MLKTWCLLGFIFVSIGCSSLRSNDEELAKVHLQIGTSQLNSGSYPQALSELLLSESLNPDDPITQNNLGLAYFFRERADLAEIHLRKALKLKSDYSDARSNLSRILIDRGRYQEAIKEAQIVTQDLTYPTPEKPLINIGMAQFKLGNYGLAQRTFQKAIDYQRDNCTAQSFYGRCLFEQHEYSKAAEALDRAASFCQRSQFDEPHYYSALSYYELGQKQKAESRLEGLLKLYPQGKYTEKAKTMLETIRR
jgi:Tfp pilus assembly protein PilF